MRVKGIVASAGKFTAIAPSITINSTTNFNQSIATFNATVNPNGATTSVKFQYSTNGSTWTDGATNTGITGSSQSTYSNQTGLAENTLYYVRAVATNSAGTSTSSSTSFTTWHLIEWASATAGTHYLTVPTVTPTNGSQVIPSIYNTFILGGGGGSGTYGSGGGSGGGYRLVSSRAFTNTSNTQLTLVVGAGGGVGSAGGYSQITASNFTSIDAGGGGAGGDYSSVGYGDNPGYTGGVNASYSDGGKNATIYLAAPGGAGIGGYGSSGAAGQYYGNGGSGGTGGSAYGYNGGAGGAGSGTTQDGSNGAYHGYGSGGQNRGGASGTAGLVRFQYYGA